MLVLAAVLSIVLAGWMTLVQPFAGRRRYQQLLERLRHDPSARLHHYRRGIAFEWGGAVLVGLLALLAHRRVRSLWPPGSHTSVTGQIPGIALALIAVTGLYRLGGPAMRKALAVQLKPVAALLPRTPAERWVFALLALTAGICEEVLYRGFGLAALRWAAPGLGHPALIAVTAVAFGMAHLYQGGRGVALTGLAGAYFAWIAISTGSLVPVMVLHAILDLRILGLPLDAVPFPAPDA
ncbi:MAG TPA: CPBP family intramembrane glutamic endopeptidase [Acidimicrobiia bacterium]|nr:CPBP family intramembrane glutamic endopeptidase [Acidimicrobiia bacterium]